MVLLGVVGESAAPAPAPVGAAGRGSLRPYPGPARSAALELRLRNLCIGPSRSVTCTFPFETSALEVQVHQGFHAIVPQVQHVPKHVLFCPNLLPGSKDMEPCVLSIRAPSCSLGAQDRDGTGPSLCPHLVLPDAHSASGAAPASQQPPTLSAGEHRAAVSCYGLAFTFDPSQHREGRPLPPAQPANRQASAPAASSGGKATASSGS